MLATRNDALAVAGYSVASPKDPRDAVAQFARSHFDAVIIGHSVEADLRKSLIEGLRRLKASVCIVFVYLGEKQTEPLADESVDITSGPIPLLRALERLLNRGSA